MPAVSCDDSQTPMRQLAQRSPRGLLVIAVVRRFRALRVIENRTTSIASIVENRSSSYSCDSEAMGVSACCAPGDAYPTGPTRSQTLHYLNASFLEVRAKEREYCYVLSCYVLFSLSLVRQHFVGSAGDLLGVAQGFVGRVLGERWAASGLAVSIADCAGNGSEIVGSLSGSSPSSSTGSSHATSGPAPIQSAR